MPILLWILGNWRIFAILGAVIALWGFGFKTGYDNRAAKVPDELAAQQKADTKQCNDDKKLTKEASDGYQARISDLNSRITHTKLLYASAPCVSVTGTSGGLNGTTGDKGLPATHGIPTAALIDYGGDAEQVGAKLDALQGFVQRVWAAKSASTVR